MRRHRPQPVPLVLRRNDRSAADDRFFVYSGKAVFGTLMRVPSGEKLNWWHWSITGFYVSPTDLGPSSGLAPSQEEAMADFAERWRVWLDWAGLREIEEKERRSLRLP
jgi:hypothetical protein